MMVNKVKSFLPRVHVLVIGPGLGREASVMEATKRIIAAAREKKVPLGKSVPAKSTSSPFSFSSTLSLLSCLSPFLPSVFLQ